MYPSYLRLVFNGIHLFGYRMCKFLAAKDVEEGISAQMLVVGTHVFLSWISLLFLSILLDV